MNFYKPLQLTRLIRIRPYSLRAMSDKPAKAREGSHNQFYNREGARMVAGCICMNETKDKVVMILSHVKKRIWVFPKGGIETDEADDYQKAAVRESWEEAGVEGEIIQKLPVVGDIRGKKAPVLKGPFDARRPRPKSEFHFYEMIVNNLENEWPELHKRDRKWFTYSEAKRNLITARRPEPLKALESSSMVRD